jgi:Tfp pilus assembly protein PilN
MINLLPPEVKTGYRYARRNVSLRKWVLVCLIGLIGLGIIVTYGLLSLRQENARYDKQIAAIETQLKKDKLEQTKTQIKDISSSLKLAVQVLSNEVLFSKLIQQIGAVMPKGTVLTGLTINQLNGGIDLSAVSTTYGSATQVQVNLADPENKIFSKVDINSINCGGTAQNATYPCTVQLRALFNTTNPFLLINQGKKP